MGKTEKDLVQAMGESVRPFVRRLLKRGVPFGEVQKKLRQIYVEVAEQELDTDGLLPSDSRIALLTGLNRKEVKRLRQDTAQDDEQGTFRLNLLTSLVGRWVSEASGQPAPLPYQSKRGPSFTRLAQSVTADIAPRVMLDELVRIGVAQLLEDDRVELQTDSLVPSMGDPEQLKILAEDPAELVDIMLRNVLHEEEEPLLQRKVYYDNIGREASVKVRQIMRREGERFLRRINQILSRFDRDRNPDAPGGERFKAGVGVYFFDDPLARSAPQSSQRKRIRSRRKQAAKGKKSNEN